MTYQTASNASYQPGAHEKCRLSMLGNLCAVFVFAAHPAPAASFGPPPNTAIVVPVCTDMAAFSRAAFSLIQSRHADPVLEAFLPTTLGGVVLTIESQAGTDLSTTSPAFEAFLASLGKTRADFALASAYAPGGLRAQVGAWRVTGADPSLLLPGFKAAMQASSNTPLTQGEEVLGGHKVTRIGDPGQLTGGPLYVFVLTDSLFFVQTPEHALAQEAMEKLPR